MAHLQTSTAYYSVNSASTSTNYDVFISHRGPDVKNTFAGHLYYRLLSHGFRPFFDREELQVGEFLSPQIERAIITASVHIVIFSPGYADSRWCLDELLLILDNKSGVTIIPVFYNVKPSELRWTGRYVQALNNHEQNGRYDHRTLEKWRKALYEVSYIIGLELEAYNGDEAKLLDNVVQCVLKKGRKTGLNVARYPTGPPENVENSEITVSLQHRQNGKVKILSSVGVGMGGLVKLTTLAKKFLNKPSSNFAHGQVEEGTLINQDQKIVMFKMKTLIAATENFHQDNKLGEGGFGPVYKGTTQDGREIAVKKLTLTSCQGNAEFLNEINVISKIQHRNIVSLLGCCEEGSERMIVYEYLPNNSLDKILFDPYKRAQLDWEKRYNIIMGIVRGLFYLHGDSQLRIIHRDIKASNILLDQKLNPKIADFGLAKILTHDHETHISPKVAGTYEDEIHITREDDTHISTRVCGTLGYMAPEYAMQGHLSVKADVFSFGVLLLELVTGRKNMDFNLSPEMQMLLEWAWRSYTQQNIEEMIDPSIIETCDMEQASRCIHVALLCTQEDSSLRPPMWTANFMLSSRSAMLPEPQKPYFLTASTEPQKPSFLTASTSSVSDRQVSISSILTASTSSVSDRQVSISSSLGDSLSLQSRGKGIAKEQVMPHSPLDFDHRPLVDEVGIDAPVMFREEWDRLIQHRPGEGPSTQHCPRGAT